MAKKKLRHVQHARKTSKAKTGSVKPNGDYLVIVQGWMFIVAFAIMLGIGYIVGTYFNGVLNGGVPSVAGASIGW